MTKRTKLIIAILATSLLVLFLILRTDRSQAEKQTIQGNTSETEGENNEQQGPHGGRLLSKDDLQLEVTISEEGATPHFRVFSFDEGEPIDPAAVVLRMQIQRLGESSEFINFKKEGNYLRGIPGVEEPHSFQITAKAEWEGRNYEWVFSQLEGVVELQPEEVKASAIQIESAGPVKMQTTLEFPGEIESNKDRVAHVVPRVVGVVTQIHKALGEAVRKGDILAIIESRELADLRSDYMASLKRLELASAIYEREKTLWEKKITPEQDYLNARKDFAEAEIEVVSDKQKLLALGISQANLSGKGALTRYEIRAPFDGTIIEKHVSPGEALKEDSDIFVIADLSSVWVNMKVPAKDINLIREGQKVTVRANQQQQEASGTVSYLGPLVGEDTRSASARVVIANEIGVWRPGLFVTVEVVQSETYVPVAVKKSGLQMMEEKPVLFAQFGNYFQAQEIKTGREDHEYVEILEGLKPGQKYVAANSYLLKAELEKSGASHDH